MIQPTQNQTQICRKSDLTNFKMQKSDLTSSKSYAEKVIIFCIIEFLILSG
jgi:hypothetical protein